MKYRSPDYPVFVSWIGQIIFKLAGWRVENNLPDYPKMVVTGAPHTSNWDGIIFILVTFALRARMNWLGKHTLFRAPIGWIMRLGGGVPINRQTTKNAVEQVVNAFNERKRMVLVIAPEGTRKRTDHWRSGFYYIALNAKVPIVLAYVDYPRKRVGIGPAVHPSGDIDADFEIFRAFYADKVGRHPEKKGNIQPPPQKS